MNVSNSFCLAEVGLFPAPLTWKKEITSSQCNGATSVSREISNEEKTQEEGEGKRKGKEGLDPPRTPPSGLI